MYALSVKSIRVLNMEMLVEKPSFPEGVLSGPIGAGSCLLRYKGRGRNRCKDQKGREDMSVKSRKGKKQNE